MNRLAYQSLTANPDHQSLSFEELRLNDVSRTARAARTTASATAGTEEDEVDLMGNSRLGVLDHILSCEPVNEVAMKLVR